MAAKKQAKGRAKGLSKVSRKSRQIMTKLDTLRKYDAKAKAHNKKVAKKGSSQTKGRAKVALSTDKIVAARVNKIHKSIRKAASKRLRGRPQAKGRADLRESFLTTAAGANRKRLSATKKRMSRPQRMK